LHSSALIKLLADPAPFRAILLGAYAGLAAGAKYFGLCSCHLRLQPSCSFQALVAKGAHGALRHLCMSCSSAVIPAAAVTVIAAAIPRSARRCGSTAVRKIRVSWSRRSLPRPARIVLGEPQLRPNADIADIVVTANLAYDRFKNYAVRKDMVSKPVLGYCRHPTRCRISMGPMDGHFRVFQSQCSGWSPWTGPRAA